MLDIKFIRDNKDLVNAGAKKKHLNFTVDELIKIDNKRRELLSSIEAKKAEQNEVSKKMPTATAEERQSLITAMTTLKEGLQKEEDDLKKIMKKWQEQMLEVPNMPDMTVPEGGEDDYQEVKTWGSVPQFTFSPKSHIELAEQNHWVDFERGTKVAGFRGYFLKGDLALLEMALWHYVMDSWTKKGFEPMLVPSLVRREALLGTGYLPQGEEDLYKDGNDYLAGTGEVATMYYHSGEVIDLIQPKKFIAWSPCFRKEAGSHNKDIKGLVRVHEFYKCEQVVLCEASHQTTVELHEEIREHAEKLMEELGIPYRTILLAAGDIGLGQVKKYDIEGWVPSQNKYRETHSASYFHDFQTRRLNIRYRDAEGKLRYAHSLNNTAAATPRLLTMIIENFQNEDGSVKVPEVLQKYLGKALMKG